MRSKKYKGEKFVQYSDSTAKGPRHIFPWQLIQPHPKHSVCEHEPAYLMDD